MEQRMRDLSRENNLEHVLLCSFWGNKTDLSLHALSEARVHSSGSLETILANDLPHLLAFIDGQLGPAARVDIVVDNYAFELFNDLMLARALLQTKKCSSVVIHCKAFPIFVSDATRADVEQMIAWANLSALEIAVEAHEYWNSQYEWFEAMPALLRESLSRAALCVVKGDANYRKLVGERRYPCDKPFAECVSYFPARAVAALRGVKCELVVGVPQTVCEAERKQNSNWTNDGSRGVVQFAVLI